MQKWFSSRWLPSDREAGRNGGCLAFVSLMHENELLALYLVIPLREMAPLKLWWLRWAVYFLAARRPHGEEEREA